VDQVFKHGQGAAFALRLTRLLRASKAHECLAAGFSRGETGADEGVGVVSDVRLEFGCEIGFGAAGRGQAAKALDQGSEFTHEDLSFFR
jgi:hypothetical protein